MGTQVEDLPFLLYKHGLYESTLLLTDHIHNAGYLPIIVNSLFSLSFYEQCANLVESLNETSLEERIIYLRCMNRGRKPLINMSEKCAAPRKVKETHESICGDSLIEMYRAMASDDPKEGLIDSFKKDVRNFEAVLLLSKLHHVTRRDVEDVIRGCEYEKFYHDVLFHVPKRFHPSCAQTSSLHFTALVCKDHRIFSTFTYYKVAVMYYYTGCETELFDLGTFLVTTYSDGYSFSSLGLYYLMRKKYEDAKRCFYKAKNMRGLGISYSNLKECHNAVGCGTDLGYEYHKMNDLKQAERWYKQTEKSKIRTQRYAALLISLERYDEALKLLEERETVTFNYPVCLKVCTRKHADFLPISVNEAEVETNLNLLRCFCLLFGGNVKAAFERLDSVDRDWRFFALRGFIRNLTNQMNLAVIDYHEALMKANRVSVLSDLLGHAIDVISKREENKAWQFGIELFEAMNLKKTNLNYI